MASPARNIYEVNLRQYTAEGTFAAFSQHLPRLKDMGVDVIWFMPITTISQGHKKGTLGSYYASADYREINPEFGNLEDFKALVQKIHSLGMRVILDWVANHTGWSHTWTVTNPEFYLHDDDGTFQVVRGMDDIIQLDHTNAAMRSAMTDAMLYWIVETGIDGFRCDLADWVPLDFWKDAKALLSQTKDLYWLGEFDMIDSTQYMQVFDCAYTWRWMHATRSYNLGQKSIAELMEVLKLYQPFIAQGLSPAWFTSNHDENSWNGTEYEKYDPWALALEVFSYTWPGTPLVYSGQELPNLKRLKFFDKDEIEWGSATPKLQDFYTKLNELRKEPAIAHQGDNVEIKTNEGGLISFLRTGERSFWIAINLSTEDQSLNVPAEIQSLEMKDLFCGRNFSPERQILKPGDFRIFKVLNP